MILICKGLPCPLYPDLILWRMLEVPDGGLKSWSWHEYGQKSLVHPCSNLGSLPWIWRCKEHPCHFSLELGFRGCWRFLTGVWLLIWIWVYPVFFDTPMLQILSLYLYFESANNIHVHKVLIRGFGGCWGILTGVWHLNLSLDMVTCLW